jgi:hypothetical protein
LRYFGLLAFFLLAIAKHAAAEDKPNEIMVSDKACTERKLATCMMEKPYPVRGGVQLPQCPQGTTETGRYREEIPYVRCKPSTATAVFARPDFDAEYARCKILVDNFPSQYGENCLKPQTDERQLQRFSSILSQIEKRICGQGDASKCDDLNKVPE